MRQELFGWHVCPEEERDRDRDERERERERERSYLTAPGS